MGALDRGWPGWLLVGLALLVTGCAKEDTERLASVGHKVALQAEALTGNDGKLSRGWQAMRGEWSEPALDARVGLRLRWDNSLAGAQIQVTTSAGAVELKGTVRDLTQRRRALEVAESTAGVEKVTDALEVSAGQP
jgi:osmotically-inducible protein OsmY